MTAIFTNKEIRGYLRCPGMLEKEIADLQADICVYRAMMPELEDADCYPAAMSYDRTKVQHTTITSGVERAAMRHIAKMERAERDITWCDERIVELKALQWAIQTENTALSPVQKMIHAALYPKYQSYVKVGITYNYSSDYIKRLDCDYLQRIRERVKNRTK